MSRKKPTGDDPPSLFDLPLHEDSADAAEGSAEEERAPAVESTSETEPAPGRKKLEQSPLFTEDALEDAAREDAAREEALAEELDDRVLLRHRLLGGVLDLAVHAGVLAVVLGALWTLGVWSAATPPDPVQWVAIGLFLLLFSFLYTAIPLAFWGRTPGMSRVHHAARAADGEPLTFSQTVRRWLGALLTLAFAGLPLLMAIGERPSPADRLSQSQTLVE